MYIAAQIWRCTRAEGGILSPDGKEEMVRGRCQAARAVLVALAIGVAVPTAAVAGKAVVSGQQKLQLTVALSPAKAGARGVTLHFHETDLGTKSGQQPPYNTKDIIFRMPTGLTLRTSALPSCPESKAIAPNGSVAVCPAGSKVGAGTVTVNARPSIPQLITGTIRLYNGKDDGRFGGFAKDSPELILDVKTSIGVNVTDFFHVVKTAKGNLELIWYLDQAGQARDRPG